MNFGNWILVSFILFALFIGSLVTVCVREDISLVSRSYYQEELNHQKKMGQMENASKLSEQPSFTFAEGVLKVKFQYWNEVTSGELKVMRPSDAKLDTKFTLAKGQEQDQEFVVEHWNKGLYRVSMKWEMNGQEYFVEKLMNF